MILLPLLIALMLVMFTWVGIIATLLIELVASFVKRLLKNLRNRKTGV